MYNYTTGRYTPAYNCTTGVYTPAYNYTTGRYTPAYNYTYWQIELPFIMLETDLLAIHALLKI